ncbi:50S ribosomal protein L25/general stress protein Ctc [Legionella jordanis]|uniref:Large ribosomal subunit protein bL25 n=1 Tax=Legionella jordanis TaxID=456 RepID=A0A0W0V9N3_9GAMM|nr:50S ribosomal protein L25/general stress protein Ctc [Legionella jordanis]KTD16808.1 50S ribosomal protein L25 [Legionella jordanis]RMX03667.1 50S ribosomal protein L25/general stress protein Ctc [Legionella jordanis]RMX22272.1 50S ribosomal protein L25/general stress protein Ctc [Legionella jordanis]VEH11725.1 50S ribosomal protein L25 [Legionella jordanis]HAT8712963.1 50S ribosomal protein L25/general stress protein Ctc [Legionella jordanis]
MSTIVLEAESRKDIGKGASRRLRRLENKVPAVIYGGEKAPKAIHLLHNKVVKALENESIYSSVFDLNVDGKVEHVILKDLQRHPYKPVILHMDLQRVSAKDILVKHVPLHFTNEQNAKGVRAGGIITHTMTQVEVKCQVKNLPEFIEVDMTDVALDDVVHLSDLKLPKGVQLTVDAKDGSHNLPVVSIHAPRTGAAEEESAKTAAPSAEEAPEQE